MLSWIIAAVAAIALAIAPSVVRAQVPPAWPANQAGGQCAGVTAGVGPIVPLSPTQTFTTSNATFIAGVANTVIHVCQLDITGVPTTGGTLTVSTGSNANCAANNVVRKTFQVGIAATGFYVSFTNGLGTDMFPVPSGFFVCIGGATFVGSITINAMAAQY